MAIGFPPSPAVGTPHTYAGKEWEWTGNGWKKKASSSSHSGGTVLRPYELVYVYQYIGPITRGLRDLPILKEVEYV